MVARLKQVSAYQKSYPNVSIWKWQGEPIELPIFKGMNIEIAKLKANEIDWN